MFVIRLRNGKYVLLEFVDYDKVISPLSLDSNISRMAVGILVLKKIVLAVLV